MEIAADQELADLEKQKLAFEGTVRALKAALKVRVGLDTTQPKKTLTGAVRGVTDNSRVWLSWAYRPSRGFRNRTLCRSEVGLQDSLEIAADQELADLEKQKLAFEGTVRALKAALKVRVGLDTTQPEKTLTGAVRGVTDNSRV